ncbi:hypothetical protein JOQ06_024198, partial [Pogonophryne albipinna]
MEQRRCEMRRAREWFLRCVVAVLLWSAASAQIRYSISEEVNEGTVVGNIVKDLGLDKSTLKYRKYRIVSSNADPLFHVNQNDGVLYVSRKIDREEVCAQSSTCLMNLKTVLENPLEVHYVVVEVLDINDHSPSFPEEVKQLDIFESVLPGARFQLKASRDPDSGPFSVQHYKLSQNDYFRLEVRDKGEDGKIPILILQKSLDREAAGINTLVLTALDGGKPPKSGNMNIVVKVMDVNDNTPIFSKDGYSVTLSENAPVGTTIVQVNATDLDEGQNGEVYYSFGNNVNNKLFELFNINPSTGEITVKGLIDYEQRDKYEIEIQASDKGFAPQTTEKSVIIQIVDVNDNAPEIEVTSFSNSIPEDSRPGTTVALISVNDLDSGLNGKVFCSIVEDVPFVLTPSLQDKMFSLVTKSPLDREKQSQYVLTITAKDAGQPPLSSEKTIHVVVSDVNDNSPEFSLSPYTFYITEANEPGTSVFSVKALDRDENDNAQITYHILRDGSEGKKVTSFLNINSETGDILALKSFDFETLKTFKFQVVATDSGTPSLSSNVTVHVFILDQNDNTPVILYPVSSNGSAEGVEEIPRNVNAGHLVTKVRAYDADIGYNGWLLFSLQEVTAHSLFGLDRYTGQIRTLRSFTETDEAEHKLLILVKDNGNVSLSATATVVVKLVEPREAFAAADVKSATTDDEDNNVTFYLMITLGSVSTLFLISIIVLIAMQCSKSTDYTSKYLQETNYDGTLCHSIQYRSGDKRYMLVGPRMSIGSTIVPGSHANTLVLPDRRGTSTEEVKIGTAVGNIAKDLGVDKSTLKERGYRIVYGSTEPPFRVNQDDGILYVNQIIDREEVCDRSKVCVIDLKTVLENPLEVHYVAVEILDFQVVATDSGTPSLSSNVTVHVFILDQNDNAPVILYPVSSNGSAEGVEEIPRNVNAGHLVTKVRAYDADIGYNGWLLFSLQEVTAHSLFGLDRYTGQIRTLRSFTETDEAEHKLLILVKDNGNVSLSATATVVVKLVEPREAFAAADVKSATKDDEDNNVTFYLMITLGSVSTLFLISIIVLIAMQCSKSTDYTSKYLQETNYDGTLCHSIQYRSGDKRYMLVGPRMSIGSTIVPGSHANTLVLPDRRGTSTENDGVLYVSRKIDREGVCERSNEEKTLEISESVLPGARFPLQAARDPDGGPFTVQQYKLSHNGHFRLEVKDHAFDRDENDNALINYHILRDGSEGNKLTSFLNINSETGDILALKSFDFETLKTFQFQVVATDSGTPSLSSNVTVHVFLLDQNDNAPVILYPVSSNGSAEGVEEIPRNVNAGHLVTKVRAYDADIGYNGWLLFSLQEVTAHSLFGLDRYTGQIRTLRSFTETDEAEHKLLILVKDNGNVSLSATATVVVKLVEPREAFAAADVKSATKDDEDNNVTFYLMITLGSVSTLFLISIIVLIAMQCSKSTDYTSKYLQETNYDGTLCHSIQYRSGDKRYMLVGPRMSIGSTIVPGSHANTLVLPDRRGTSTEPNYKDCNGLLMISGLTMEQRRCEMRRAREWFLRCVVAVLLWSAASAQIRYSISEEVDEGTVVGNIAKDLGLDKSTLKYRKYRIVSSNADPLFHVNQNDGVLYVSRKIDREEVCAQSSTCLMNLKTVLENPLEVHYVVVEVLDINDHSPSFPEEVKQLDISESVLPGARFQLKASRDPDSGPFSVQHYKLSQNDYFRLEVRDKGEDALDRDENDNAQINYHILRDGSEGKKVTSYLNINSETGDILALKSFDFETLKTFQFQVVATDSGTPSLSSNVTVHVFILDQNDNAPVILYPVSSNGSAEGVEEIPRNVNAGHLVTKVRAYDADIGYNGWLLFSLQEVTAHSLFGLDRYTGQIRTLRSFTETDEAEHKLLILVKDNGNVSLSATATVVVKLVEPREAFAAADVKSATTDDEDNNVTFYLMITLGSVSTLFLISIIVLIAMQCSKSTDYTSKYLQETNYDGTLCHSIQYRSGDKRYMLVGPRMSIGSTIVPGSHANTLVLPDRRGTSTEPNYKDCNGLLMISGLTMEQRRCEMRRARGWFLRCVVAVLLWSAASAQIRYSISEEVDEGTVVGNIAKDLGLDKSTLKDRKYRIVSSNADPLFHVNQNDGVLYVSRKIDREEVCAQSSTCLMNLKTVLENPLEVHYVVVEVLDINDHSPSFPEEEKQLDISESVLPGARFQLKASRDPDSGPFSVQHYKLSQNDYFRLEVRDKGEDETDEAEHKLLILVKDNGNVSLSATATVVVKLVEPREAFAAADVKSATKDDEDNNVTFYLMITLGSVSTLFLISIIVLIAMQCSKSTDYTSKYLQETNFDGTLCHSIQYRSGDKRYMLVGPRMSIGSTIVPGSHANTLVLPDRRGTSTE